MSASHDLRARLHPSFDPDQAPPPAVSTVAPPVPTPAATRSVSTASADQEELDDETELFVDAALSHGDSFTPVPPPVSDARPATEPPAAKRPKWPLVTGGLALVLAVGITAAVLVNRPGATPPRAAGTLAVAKVTDFDPKADGGSGGENPKQAKLAADGDPKTAWRTERYRRLPTLGGLKPGVGLVVDLGAVRQVTRVEVLLSGKGTTVEVRVPKTKADAAPMKSEADWTTVAGVADATDRAGLDLTEARQTRYLLVYLTSLAPSGGGYFRTGIAEITVAGT